MKNRKNAAVIVVLMGLMLLGFHSCSQYPDNSGITFVSKMDRVSKAWKVENYKVNDVDYTSLYASYTETYTKQAAYSFQWAILGGTGIWAFQNKDAEIQITGGSNVITKTLYILKLEEKSFWYYYMDGDSRKEFHLVPQ